MKCHFAVVFHLHVAVFVFSEETSISFQVQCWNSIVFPGWMITAEQERWTRTAAFQGVSGPVWGAPGATCPDAP